jgi:hypothetical protein
MPGSSAAAVRDRSSRTPSNGGRLRPVTFFNSQTVPVAAPDVKIGGGNEVWKRVLPLTEFSPRGRGFSLARLVGERRETAQIDLEFQRASEDC